MAHAPPVIVQPTQTNNTPAAIIFLHGFGDDAEGWTGLVQQFQSAGKLPHVKWILPNAPHNHDAMAQAWFEPKGFSPIPMPKRAGEDDEDDEDDEEGMMKSVDYICGLIEGEMNKGLSLERIVLGGFSQGCAISLLVGLISRYQGRLRGVAALSGYLPLSGKVKKVVEKAVGSATTVDGQWKTKWFLAHGTRDQLVPVRMFREYGDKLTGCVGDTNVEAHAYDGMPHSTVGAEIRDLCSWLENLLPAREAGT